MHWYAFMTRSGAGFMDNRRRFAEFAAAEQMRADGLEAFAPTLQILRRPHRHAKRRIVAVAPLIPGYCFARLPAPPARDQWRRWSYVLSVVRRGMVPAALPADQIESLQRLDGTTAPLSGPLPYDASGKIISGDASARRVPKPGDRATSLSGLQGIVETIDRERAVLLVEMLGSLRRANVGVHDLLAG